MKQPNQQTLDLLYNYEVGGGESYYNKYLKGPTWPGGASGVTLAIGIDCGYYNHDTIREMFSFMTDEHLNAVLKGVGLTGISAKNYVRTIKPLNIIVPWSEAEKIFQQYTWPKFAGLAEKTFPGLDQLCDNAYGAIVSLVFNRGSSLQGSSRTEMRNIRDLVLQRDYKGIASELRKMKRIWEGKGLDGLIARREAEAKLVETCI
jgi:hypothetical protein